MWVVVRFAVTSESEAVTGTATHYLTAGGGWSPRLADARAFGSEDDATAAADDAEAPDDAKDDLIVAVWAQA